MEERVEKTFKITKIKTAFDYTSTAESLNVFKQTEFYVKEFPKHFDAVIAHLDFSVKSKLELRRAVNTLFIYSHIAFSPCSICDEKNHSFIINLEKVKIESEDFPKIKKVYFQGTDLLFGDGKGIIYKASLFFDRRAFPVFCKVIYISDNEKNAIFGTYCPKYNVLETSDMTHSDLGAIVAPFFLSAVFETVNVRRVNISFEELPLLTIGADPEFEQLSSDRSYKVIRSTFTGTSSPIGCDGSGCQIELRPKPSATPEGLVKNIRDLIKRISIRGIPISVKGDIFPLGCHIHFGVPNEFSSEKNFNIMARLLDEFLGKLLIELSGKERKQYKALTAYRSQLWGFEYRTLPSAVLLNPKIAYIVLKTAFNLINKILEKGELTVKIPPTYEEYRELCGLSLDEYEYLMNFVNEYREYDGTDITKYWVKKKKTNSDVNITFRDEWNESTIAVFTYLLKSKIKKTNIILYGLRKDRGNVVSGFSETNKIREKFDIIPHPIEIDNEAYYFGLPYWIRMNEDVKDEEIEFVCDCIADEIMKEKEVSYER